MAVISGQITIAAAGTAVQGPATAKGSHVALKAHPDNTDVIWIGDDGSGDVSPASGFPINPGEGVVIPLPKRGAAGLSSLWFDADVSGEKLCWLVLE